MNGGRMLLLAAAAIPEGRVFGMDQQTLISTGIQLLNACILAAALSYILYKPVRNFLQKRSERINTQMKTAEENVIKAEELKAQYEQKLENMEQERAEILAAAQKQAEEKSRQMLESAQKEVAALLEQTMHEISGERERVNEEIRTHIIEVASALAEKFVAQSLDEETMDKLCDETIAELEGAAWQA